MFHLQDSQGLYVLCSEYHRWLQAVSRGLRMAPAAATLRNPNQCWMCLRMSASHLDNLQHMRTHLSPQPYLCMLCGQRFATGQQMNKHTLEHSHRTLLPPQVSVKKLPTRNRSDPCILLARKSPSTPPQVTVKRSPSKNHVHPRTYLPRRSSSTPAEASVKRSRADPRHSVRRSSDTALASLRAAGTPRPSPPRSETTSFKHTDQTQPAAKRGPGRPRKTAPDGGPRRSWPPGGKDAGPVRNPRGRPRKVSYDDAVLPAGPDTPHPPPPPPPLPVKSLFGLLEASSYSPVKLFDTGSRQGSRSVARDPVPRMASEAGPDIPRDTPRDTPVAPAPPPVKERSAISRRRSVGSFVCGLCGRRFASKTALEYHKIFHV